MSATSGLPRPLLVIVRGKPGSGKTTLARVPALRVDTTCGYVPGLDAIIAFCRDARAGRPYCTAR